MGRLLDEQKVKAYLYTRFPLMIPGLKNAIEAVPTVLEPIVTLKKIDGLLWAENAEIWDYSVTPAECIYEGCFNHPFENESEYYNYKIVGLDLGKRGVMVIGIKK